MAERPTISLLLRIADQKLRVRIPEEEKERFERIAQYTEKNFAEISSQKVTGGVQAWAMTAFQIASDLYEVQEEQGLAPADRDRIQRMIQRIEAVTSDE